MNHRRRAAGRVALALAGIAGVLALSALVTGGFRVYVLGIPLSVRGEHRAALMALVLAVIGYLLLDRDSQLTRTLSRQSLLTATRLHAWTARRSASLLALVVLAAASLVFIAGGRLGVRSAGGSDPSGYVSESVLWREGSLRVRQDIAAAAPWPNAGGTFAPLAYKPSEDHTRVPVCAPGLPLLMTLAHVTIGTCGPYFIGPLCAAMLVWFTYALGVRVAGPTVGAMAALAMAASPTMLFMSLSAMSDVPAAAFWTAALVLACGRGAGSTIASGAAAAVAIMIRPNLAPLVMFPLTLVVWPLQPGLVAAVRRGVLFGVACAPSVVVVGWVFNTLYGSPFESGYGPADALFAAGHFTKNITRYPRWLWETQTPVAFLFLLAPVLLWRRGERRGPLPWVLLGFIGVTFASYVFYEPFDAWWFLRFLLPAFAPILVLSAAVAWWAVSGWPSWARGLAAVAVTTFVVHHGIALSRERGIVFVREGEQKYADAGRYIDRELPLNAVVLSMQHSGSVGLYSGRPILRYDLLSPEWLDGALDHLRRERYAPYLLLEDWEVTIFRERFASQKAIALVDASPMAARPDGHVLLFDGRVGAASVGPPKVMPPTSGCGTKR